MFEISPAEMLHNEESNTAIDPTLLQVLQHIHRHTHTNVTEKEKYTMLLGITKVSLRCIEMPYHLYYCKALFC